MPRRGNVPKREILPDPVYNSVLVTKLINSIMLDGKKGVAQKVVYDAFDIIKNKTGKDPLEAFTEAMNNIMPSLEVKARRVGGATYQVPIEVRPERRQTLGLRWLTLYARKRSEKTMKERYTRGTAQSDNTKFGLFAMFTIIPFITTSLGIIPMLFYLSLIHISRSHGMYPVLVESRYFLSGTASVYS